MLDFTENKHDCTGCGACASACPIHCISMQKDEEGFLYPVASDACIQCGRCQTVCPLNEKERPILSDAFRKKAFCAVTKDEKIWKRSASGGAFSEICRAFGDRDTIVCGAAWDGLRVHHICVEGVDAIAPLCKSKYVASDTENVFSEIKAFIKAGRKVIFCGTPCQVAGLRKVIGKEFDSLLCIDLICHGVGSPDVFTACMEQLGKQFEGAVQSYEFRAKRSAYESDHIQKTDLENGQQIYLVNDPYIQLFLKQTCLRPSCGKNCRFRCEQRQGDITIADFKGLTNVFPALQGTKKNYSSVIFNTPKGYALLPALRESMEMLPCDMEVIKKHNPLFYRQTWFSDIRDAFFAEFIEDPCRTIQRYTKPAQMIRMSWKKRIWMLLPQSVRRIVLRRVVHGGASECETCAITRIWLCKMQIDQ